MEKVAVGKPVLIALIVALVLAIAAAAFLLGRQSAVPTRVVVEAAPRFEARAAPAAPTDADPAPQAPPEASAPRAPEPEKPSPTTAFAPPTAEIEKAAPPARDTAGNAVARAAPTANEAAAVATYFDQIQAIQVESGAADGQAYAQQVLASAMQGDASGFDRLAQDLERSESRARAISPPDPCKAYHASLLALLGESKRMIRNLARAFATKDMNAMTGVAESANQMQTRTEALQQEEKRLRRQYHLREAG